MFKDLFYILVGSVTVDVFMHVRQTEKQRCDGKQLSARLTANMISVRGMSVSIDVEKLPKKAPTFNVASMQMPQSAQTHIPPYFSS